MVGTWPEHLWRLVGLGQVEVDEVSGFVGAGVGLVVVVLGHHHSSWLHMVGRGKARHGCRSKGAPRLLSMHV